MKDAFISYAREDLAFVRELVERLEARELDVWVDLEGIHAGEAWSARIEAGIEESDAFVFVISAHSARSTACRAEVAHAVRSNKRILPVVRRETTEALPEAVASRQWLFLRPEDDLEQGVEDLVRGVTVDPAFVREHTRLLVRSSEWEGRGRDKGYLLRGSDLERSERWLTEASTHEEPRPTRSQSEYVLASRRAATRRSRILTASVTGGLLVALVLAGLAWVQRQAAQERARIALSRQLAAQASSVQAEGNGDLGLLLAVEAYRESATVEALGSLMALLSLDPPLDAFLHGHQLAVTSTAFSPDGRWLAAAGCEVVSELDLCERYAVRVWEPETGEEQTPLRTLQEGRVELAFSPDGTLLAAGSADGSVQLWSTASWERIRTLETGRAGVERVAFSPDGRRLVAAAALGMVGWEVASGRPLRPVSPSRRGYVDVVFTPSGRWLLTAHRDGVIRIWSVTDDGVAWSGAPADSLVGHDGRVVSLAVSPDGRRLVSGGWDDRVLLWDMEARSRIRTLMDGRDVTHVAFDGTGARLLVTERVGEEDGRVTLIDAASGRMLGAFPGRGRVASDAGSGRMAFGSGDGTVGVRRTLDHPPLTRVLATHAGEGLAFLPRGFLVTSRPDTRITDLDDGRVLWRTPVAGDRLAVSADGSTLASASGDTLRAWRLEPSPTGEGIAARALLGGGMVDPSGDPDAIALDATGHRLAVGGSSDSVRVWALDAPGAPVAVFSTPADVYRLTFHPRRGTLFSGSEDGSVIEWDLTGAEPRGTFFGTHTPREDGLTALAFTPDGARLLTSGLEHSVLWDVDTGVPVGPPFPGSNGVLRPDGRLLAVMVYDRIVLMDTGTLKVVGRDLGTHEAYTPLAWGADGRWLVSSGSERDLAWDLDVASWLARGCAIAHRDLSAEEAMLYLGRSADPVCPGQASPRALPEDALGLFHRGDRLLARGRTEAASRALGRAAELVQETTDAELANRICWKGVTGGAAGVVMTACERAVALEPDEAGYRDSRGVGRAVLGDRAGALEDFRAYVAAYGGEDGSRGRRAARRRAWIAALERGEDPLDPLTLRTLRSEYF